MSGESREGAKPRRTLVQAGQWVGGMEDDEEVKAIAVLSIEPDRPTLGLLNILPEENGKTGIRELPYLTIRGIIERDDDTMQFAPDCLIACSGLECVSHSDVLEAFHLTFRFGTRCEENRPRVERNILEATASIPTRFHHSLPLRISLRKRMAPCSSEWPLEQATTWESFKAWADSKESKGWIFRGQADAGFSLASSFHRKSRYDLFRYLSGPLVDDLLSLKEKRPTVFEEIEGLDNVDKILKTHAPDLEKHKVNIFEKLTANPEETLRLTRFLRHHGYPTPILDWTTDYKVSAFFATEESSNPYSDDFVIYAFNYDSLREKLGSDPGSQNLLHPGNLIRRIDPKEDLLGRLRTREEPQSALYLWSGVHDLEGFIRWMEMADNGRTKDQFLRRFRFSGQERKCVREEVESQGITRYELFGDTDSLMKDLAEKSFSGSA